MKDMTFISAMKDFFGFKEGQKLSDFNMELKALDDKDRAWFKENLRTVGYNITN